MTRTLAAKRVHVCPILVSGRESEVCGQRAHWLIRLHGRRLKVCEDCRDYMIAVGGWSLVR